MHPFRPAAPEPPTASRGAIGRPDEPDHLDDPDDLDGRDGRVALRLPAPPAPPRRAHLPLLASLVPVLGALVLWLATGTAMMLWFALLGPLIAAASLADGARGARRERIRHAREQERAREQVAAAVGRRHAVERESRWLRHPDVVGMLAPGPSGADRVWRTGPARADRLVVGRGCARSALRVEGGGTDTASQALRRRAAVLDDAPVLLPLAAGVAVVGPTAPARAIVRALVLQLCLAHPPDALRVLPGRLGARGPEARWLAALPHAQSDWPGTTARTLAVIEPGEPVDASADIVIARADDAASAPSRCAAIVTLTDVDGAHLAWDGRVEDVRVEAVGAAQALRLAERLADRAQASYADAAGGTAPVALEAIMARSDPSDAGLAAAVGVAHGEPFRLDLVADGPHALVAGVTGSGKSELLITWVAALCATHDVDEVNFLLADFKGGTAFDALVALPHVTGVITDLDGESARRALESLRAELRHREAALVQSCGSDLRAAGLARLVIVVDEFAALIGAHPGLYDVFVDIAARGRALGMHLILGTQRAAGVFRDALLANCPLRISLRVTDAADSRALIGVDDAARLSGALSERGIALVRRAADAAPRRVRIARADAALVAGIVARAPVRQARRVWLPALPERLTLADLPPVTGADGGIRLGLADEPHRQRQSTVTLGAASRGLCVVGSSGSGRTGALRLIAAQAADHCWISADPETAWDQLTGLCAAPAEQGVVIVDDTDALLARLPAEYARAAADLLEQLIHAAGQTGGTIVLSTQRVAGAVARLAELLPRRAILATATPADHVAAGGVAADFRAHRTPGRAVLDGQPMQFALTPRREQPAAASAAISAATWAPAGTLTAVVARPGPLRRRIVALADARGATVMDVDEALHTWTAGPPTDPLRPLVCIGEGEQWHRAWRILQTVRADHDLVIDAACGADYRMLTGDRELPPYCAAGAHRAWLVEAGHAARRVVVAPPGPSC